MRTSGSGHWRVGGMIGSPFHRYIWRHLPRRLRRAALFRLVGLMAPRIDPAPPAGKRIVVAGAFRSPASPGESARLCYHALRASGYDVGKIDISPALFQETVLDASWASDTHGLEGPGTLIVHANAPLMAFATRACGRKILVGKRVIGYWVWELPSVPDDWWLGLKHVHEIWVPSQFCADAVAKIAGSIPVRIVPHPVAVDPSNRADGREACTRAAARPFTVLLMFNASSGFARKNPFAAVAAFKQAFGDDPAATLIIKAMRLRDDPAGANALRRAAAAPNIELIERTMSKDELNELYARTDAVLSLHCAEGFGLTLAEGMLHGLPVVATDWSGNVDFLDSTVGLPVKHRLTPCMDPGTDYHRPDLRWAQADVDDAAQKLRRLRDDPVTAAALGQAARQRGLAVFGVDAFRTKVAPGIGDP